ncbi:MAG: acyl-CoA thioesterase [Hymenobacter sp.]
MRSIASLSRGAGRSLQAFFATPFPMPYSQTYSVRWAELDPNGHMRHSAYADFAADLRVNWLASLGYNVPKFAELRLGPILFREGNQVYEGTARWRNHPRGRRAAKHYPRRPAAGPSCTPSTKPTAA